jgi:hypothetical protein
MYLYRVRYRRSDDPRGTVHSLSVHAEDADQARDEVRKADPRFAHTSESPRRIMSVPDGARVIVHG